MRSQGAGGGHHHGAWGCTVGQAAWVLAWTLHRTGTGDKQGGQSGSHQRLSLMTPSSPLHWLPSPHQWHGLPFLGGQDSPGGGCHMMSGAPPGRPGATFLPFCGLTGVPEEAPHPRCHLGTWACASSALPSLQSGLRPLAEPATAYKGAWSGSRLTQGMRLSQKRRRR